MHANLKILAVIAASAALLLPSCHRSVKLPPGMPKVTAAPAAPSAKQPLAEVKKASAAADEKGNSARSEVAATQQRVSAYKEQDYRKMQSLVSDLKKQGFAKQAEIDELDILVTGQEASIDRLVERLKYIADNLDHERTLRKQASEHLAEVQANIAAKEQEADTLRQQFQDMQATAADYQQVARDNHEKALKKAGEVEFLKGQRKILIVALSLVSLALAISLLIHYLRFRRGLLF